MRAAHPLRSACSTGRYVAQNSACHCDVFFCSPSKAALCVAAHTLESSWVVVWWDILLMVTLHRLFTLVPTEHEVKALLDHVDSPYIRAVLPFSPVQGKAQRDTCTVFTCC